MLVKRGLLTILIASSLLLAAQRSSAPMYGPSRTFPTTPAKIDGGVTGPHRSKADPDFTLKVESQFVGVDIVATDRAGNPVMDLKADDFEVQEDGKTRPISSFSLEKRGVGNGGTLAQLRQATKDRPEAVKTNFEANGAMVPENGCTILLIDMLNTSLSDQTLARTEAQKFIARVTPDHPVAIYALGMNLLRVQDFTSDASKLREAVDLLGTSRNPLQPANTWQGDHPLSSNPLAAAGFSDSRVGGGGSNTTAANARMREFETELVNQQTDQRVERTVKSLTALARRVAGYHGRKSLIWLSSEFPIETQSSATAGDGRPQYGTGSPRYYGSDVENLGRTLANSEIALYSVDARGLMSGAVDAGVKGDENGHKASTASYYEAQLSQNLALITAPQITMLTLADLTGGAAYFNKNDLANGLERALDDGGNFYSISFRPRSQAADGGYHTIKITTRRPGVHLRYRKGYFALDARDRDTGQREAEKMLVEQALLDQETLSTSLPLMAQVDSAHADVIDLWVHGGSLSIIEDAKSGKPMVRSEIAVVTFDSAGKLLTKSTVLVNSNLRKENLNKVVNDGLSQNVKFARLPEARRLRLAIRDIPSGRIGTIDVPLAPISAVLKAPTQ